MSLLSLLYLQEYALAFTGLPAQPDQLVAIKQLEAIKDAYQAAPGNLRSRFQHLFLNVVDNPASRVKPDGELALPDLCLGSVCGETGQECMLVRAQEHASNISWAALRVPFIASCSCRNNGTLL